jgi:hypothetical protein
MTGLSTSLALLLLLPTTPPAPDHSADAQSPGRSAFERLKSLAGTWSGKAQHGQEGGDVTVVYKVTAGGNAVEETLFAGSPHEMVTVYHMDGDDVVLTHYCTSGNAPRMKLQAPKDPNVLLFDFTGGSNMKESDFHMHSARLTFVDADHFKGSWGTLKDGKPAGDATFDLTRRP